MGTKQSFSLERQFSVDGQEWQRQKAKHDDLRALFVRLGISPTFSMRLTTVCAKWNHGIQELYAARFCPAVTSESFARHSSNVALQIKSMWY